MKIVIFIFLFILILYLIDRREEKKVVDSFGGFREKYDELITYFLNMENSKIVKMSDMSISISNKSFSLFSIVTVTHGFSNVNILWSYQSPVLGKDDLRWTFSDSTPQSLMIQKIENDIKNYVRRKLY